VLDQQANPQPAERLVSLLGLDLAFTIRLARSLQNDGLISGVPAQQSADQSWSVTPAGRLALKENRAFRNCNERRILTFVDDQASGAAEYLKITCAEWGTSFVPAPGETHLTPSRLRACVQQNSEWKQRHDFPTDIVDLCDSPKCQPAWQHVIVDRPERCHVLLLQDTDGVHGFALGLPEWFLQSVKPCFTIPLDYLAVCFPGAAVMPSHDQWRQAWRDWGQTRQLSLAELETCTLEPAGDRILVRVAPSLKPQIGTFLANKDCWIMAGNGGWRTGARIELDDT
jgi:hypothetical protein